MASEWVSLTYLDEQKPVRVNMANALSVSGIDNGSRIWFPIGTEDDCIDVAETAEKIFQLLFEVQRANRT